MSDKYDSVDERTQEIRELIKLHIQGVWPINLLSNRLTARPTQFDLGLPLINWSTDCWLIDLNVLITNDILWLTGSRLYGCYSATDGLFHDPVQAIWQPLRQRGRGHRRHPAHLFQLLHLLLDADVPTKKRRSQTLAVFWTASERTSS